MADEPTGQDLNLSELGGMLRQGAKTWAAFSKGAEIATLIERSDRVVKDLDRRRVALSETVTTLLDQKQRAQDDLDRTKAEVAEGMATLRTRMVAAVNTFNADLEKLQAQLNEVREAITATEAEHRNRVAQLQDGYREEMARAKEQHAALLTTLGNEIVTLENRRDALRAELDRHAEEVARIVAP